MNQIIVWRDSVCAGDDCDAPHEFTLPLRGETLRSFTARILDARYLASISGGHATWILQAGPEQGRPLAVIAQQWPEPRFISEADSEVATLIQAEAAPHFYIRYWCQADPERVFECLILGKPLPDRYDR